MGTSNFHRIGSIDPRNILDEYKNRALGELSDADIFDQVCAIVARPPVRGLTSFTLHAPLEVMARYGLIRLVNPTERELARLQMVASASVYGHQVESMPAAARVTTDRKLALAAALVWITAYRSVLSDRALDLGWHPPPIKDASVLEALHTSSAAAASRVWYAPDGELCAIRRILATEASIRNDIHLVKYTRACLDMGAFDPDHVRLYLAAAAHLCAVWIAEAPRATIAEALLVDRTTP